jgi:hypothetical protein
MSFPQPGDTLNGSIADSPAHPAPSADMSVTPGEQDPMTPSSFAAAPPGSNGSMPSFPTYSATTAELLAKARANAAAQPGTPGYAAVREQILKSMVTSDKLPIPTQDSAVKRGRGRGRGRGAGVPRSPATGGAASTPGSVSTPVSERGRGKVGRPRGRGRGGSGRGRGGKRKRSESMESDVSIHSGSQDYSMMAGCATQLKLDSEKPQAQDWKAELSDETNSLRDQADDSDVSETYTPIATQTKSGRAVNKPTAYVPIIPEPNKETKKRRPYRRNPEAAVCKTCQRGHSPNTNQIVFCDGCGTPYHQYCHDPPIENDVISVQEKEWLCSTCTQSRENTAAPNADGLVSGETLTMQEVCTLCPLVKNLQKTKKHRNDPASPLSLNLDLLSFSSTPAQYIQPSPSSQHPQP